MIDLVTGARITLAWDAEAKIWWLRAEAGRNVVKKAIAVTSDIDRAALSKISDAVEREMQAWLF